VTISISNRVAARFLQYVTSANTVVSESTLPAATQEPSGKRPQVPVVSQVGPLSCLCV
jgi:hypothetical protein